MHRSILVAVVCLAVLAGTAVCQNLDTIVNALSESPEQGNTPAEVEVDEAPYRFCWCRLMSGGYSIMRWEPNTGRCWSRSGSLTWKLAEESDELPEGPYEVVVIPQKERSFYAFRFNLRTGQDWHLSNYKWKPCQEPEQ